MSNNAFDNWLRDYLDETGCYKPPGGNDQLTDVIRRLVERIEHLEGIMISDEIARKQHPSLQEAWEQYQTFKKLVKR